MEIENEEGLEFSEETKKNLKRSGEDIIKGRTISLEEIKKKVL